MAFDGQAIKSGQKLEGDKALAQPTNPLLAEISNSPAYLMSGQKSAFNDVKELKFDDHCPMEEAQKKQDAFRLAEQQQRQHLDFDNASKLAFDQKQDQSKQNETLRFNDDFAMRDYYTFKFA